MEFSTHPRIRNKPVVFEPGFSRDWQTKTGELHDLQSHVSSGGAFIPAVMTGDRRSSAAFKSSELAVVDVDHGLSIEEFRRHPLAKHASWVYTTASHTEENNRFRVVFRLPQVITNAELYRAITTILIRSIGGDKACSDACRLYYGYSEATHPIWQPAAVLDCSLVEEAKAEAELERARFKQATSDFDEDDILRAIFCLEEIIEPTSDGEREPKFLPITMACNRVGAAIFPAWSDWASRGYHGKKNGQSSERYFNSSKSNKHTLGTIFHHANLDDPEWRKRLPPELIVRSEYNPAAGMPGVVGYEHSAYCEEDEGDAIFDLTYEEFAAANHQKVATKSIFDAERPWTFDPTDEPEIPEDDEPAQRGPGRPANERRPEQLTREAVTSCYPDLRYNTTTGCYEFGPITDPREISNDQIERAYLEVSWSMEASFQKLMVKDTICTIADQNRYSPVVSYLNHCVANAKPIDYFDRIASTLLGSPPEGVNNPRLKSGQLFSSTLFLAAAPFPRPAAAAARPQLGFPPLQQQ